jgi:hypothetical protein
VRLFNDVMIGIDRNDDERRMMAHVARAAGDAGSEDAATIG